MTAWLGNARGCQRAYDRVAVRTEVVRIDVGLYVRTYVRGAATTQCVCLRKAAC